MSVVLARGSRIASLFAFGELKIEASQKKRFYVLRRLEETHKGLRDPYQSRGRASPCTALLAD